MHIVRWGTIFGWAPSFPVAQATAERIVNGHRKVHTCGH